MSTNDDGPLPGDDVAAAVAIGSFPAALRTAITASGLSLDRIRYRLGLQGVRVSVPTLSNWQSGRRQPERPESLRAVTELEHVLGLPPDTLRSLLGSPKPRGRVPVATQPAAAWSRAGARLLSTMDTAADVRLRRLSQHDTVTVNPAGRLVRLRSRLVLRAGQDGANRWIDIWPTGPGQQPATIDAGWHCRAGAVSVDRRARLTAAELILDTPLSRHATAVAEYQVDFPDSGAPAGRFLRRFGLPVRDYVMEIRFDPAAVPTRCRRGNSGEMLVPSRSGSVHLVELDATGLVEVRWQM